VKRALAVSVPIISISICYWPVSNAQFPEVVAGFERLRAASKIRFWGVSNFSVRQMDDLFRIPQGDRCATNHVPYSIGDRAIERDLLPWCEQHGIVFLVIGLRRAYLSATLSNHGSAR
jgi:diketogulonate reductase-like aldo/keto reductase